MTGRPTWGATAVALDTEALPRRRRRRAARTAALVSVAFGLLALVTTGEAEAAVVRDTAADQAEHQRDDVRRQQAEAAAKLDLTTATADQVVAALATLDQQVQAETAELSEAQRAAQDAARRASELDQQIAESQHELDKLANELRDQALRRYVSPERNDSSVQLLKATTIDEAEQRRVLADTVAGNPHDLVEQTRAATAKLDGLRQQASDNRAEADSRTREQESLRRDLYLQLATQNKIKDEWDRRVAGNDTDDLSAADGQLSKAIADQKRSQAQQNPVFGPTAPAPASGNAGMIWPIAGRVSQEFGHNGHPGIDIAAPANTPIWAALPGRVVAAGWNNGGYGNLVVIDNGNGLETWYAHQNRIMVSVGQTVSKGQQIGLEGSTGNSTGPHLHFEVHVNGGRRNPRGYLPAGGP